MSEATPHDSHAHDPTLVEEDKPPVRIISISIVVVVLAIIATVIVAAQIFFSKVYGEQSRKIGESENFELRDLRATEQTRLSGYQWVDRQKGVVRIPLDRARELTLKDFANRPAGLVPITDPMGPLGPNAVDSSAVPGASAAPATSAAPDGSGSALPATSSSVAPAVSGSVAPATSSSVAPAVSGSVTPRHSGPAPTHSAPTHGGRHGGAPAPKGS